MPTLTGTLKSGTWTYDAASRTDRNIVRELIGDTNPDDPKLATRGIANEIIDAALTDKGSVLAAAMYCIDLRLAAVAMEADVGQRAAGLDTSRRFERMLQLRKLAISEQMAGLATPSAPYQSLAYRDARDNDTDSISGSQGVSAARLGMLDGDIA